jgi:hypothetical protein
VLFPILCTGICAGNISFGEMEHMQQFAEEARTAIPQSNVQLDRLRSVISPSGVIDLLLQVSLTSGH